MDLDGEELLSPGGNAFGFPRMRWLLKLGSVCCEDPGNHACGVVTRESGSCWVWVPESGQVLRMPCGPHLVQPGVLLPLRWQLHVLLQGLPQKRSSWRWPAGRHGSSPVSSFVDWCSVWPVESRLDSDGLVERREAPHPMGAGVGYQKCLLVCFSLMLRVNVCGIYKVIWNLSDL